MEVGGLPVWEGRRCPRRRRCPLHPLHPLHLYLPGSVVSTASSEEAALSWRDDPEAVQRLRCGETHGDSEQVQGGRARGNTPEGASFTPQ